MDKKSIEIFFVSKRIGGVVFYEPQKHKNLVWNFLFWESKEEGKPSLLIAGDGEYGRDDSSHKNLNSCYRELAPGVAPQVPHSSKPDGAGNFMDRLEWKSTGFGVETPESLRPLIAEALGIGMMEKKF